MDRPRAVGTGSAPPLDAAPSRYPTAPGTGDPRHVQPWLAKVLDPERFPLAARVGTTAGAHHQAISDPDHAFEFGLECVLTGIEALVRERSR